MDSHADQSSLRKLGKALVTRLGTGITRRRRRSAPQYIFFTGWGCIFVAMTAFLFTYAIFNQAESLVFYSLLSGLCLLFGLLFTHENMRGTRIQSVATTYDQAKNRWLFKLTATNLTSHSRKKINVKIKIETNGAERNWFKTLRHSAVTENFDLSAFESKELVVSFEPEKYLPQARAPSCSLASVTLESSFSLGLMRSWCVFKPRELVEHFEHVSLPPTKSILKSTLQRPEEITICWSQTPYTNQHPSRILWNRFFATGELYARQEELHAASRAVGSHSNPPSLKTDAALRIQKVLLILLGSYWAFEHFEEFRAAGGSEAWYLAASLPLVAVFAALAQTFISGMSVPIRLQRLVLSVSRVMTLLLPLLMGYLFLEHNGVPKPQAEALGLELFPILFLMASFRHATSVTVLRVDNSGRQSQKHHKSDAFIGSGLLLLTGCPLFIAGSDKTASLSHFAAAILVFGCYYSLYLTQLSDKSRYFEFDKTDASILVRVCLQATPVLLLLASLFTLIPDALKDFNLLGSRSQQSDHSQTGFGTTLNPGAIALLKDDDRLALSLTVVPESFSGSAEKSWSDRFKRSVYLRGATLSKGFGFKWQQWTADYYTLQSARSSSFEMSADSQQNSSKQAEKIPGLRLIAEQEEARDGHLFVPEGFEVLHFFQSSNRTFTADGTKRSAGRLVQFRPKTAIVFGADPRKKIFYELAEQRQQGGQAAVGDPPLREHFYDKGAQGGELQGTETDDAIVLEPKFREQFQKSAGSTRTILDQVETFFRSGSFTYARSRTSKNFADFLYGSRRGYCEHFAAAAASILRFQGLAARIVTGYAGGEYNADTQKILFVNSEAHAWVEVWIKEEARWERLDPTQWAAFSEYQNKSRTSSIASKHTWTVVVFLGFAILLVAALSFLKRRRMRRRARLDRFNTKAAEPKSQSLELTIVETFELCFGESRQSFETFRSYFMRIKTRSNALQKLKNQGLENAESLAEAICVCFEELSYSNKSGEERALLEARILESIDRLRKSSSPLAESKLK